MTNLDLLSQAFAHATGQPPAKWRKIILTAANRTGKRHRLHERCPDFDQRLKELKQEAPGILNLLINAQ